MAYQLYNGKYRWGAHDASQQQRMERTLETWLNNPLCTIGEVAQKAGIDVSTFTDYRHNDAWMETYRHECDRRFQSLRAAALENLENAVLDGDWKATQYVLDGVGYNATQRLDVDGNTTITINVQDGEAL